METIPPPPDADPPWLQVARLELGVRERLPDGRPNPRVHEYFQATRFKGGTALDAWCSAFLCWVMERAGIASTDRAAARSWLEWGVPLDAPRVGCVAVYWRGKPNAHTGHVGTWVGSEGLYDRVLGGNEGDAVAVRPYAKARLLGYRWVSQSPRHLPP